MSTLRRVVDILGRVLIGLGVLLLLFTAYQIWGTSVQEARTQSGLRTQLQAETNSEAVRHALAEESALDKLPTGPPVVAPTTTAPAEGNPIGDIRIPVIGINQVVVEGTNTPDLRKGPGHYTGTPLPGQAGNVAIAGHRTTYGHPFYNLDSVKVGDPIVLTTLQGIFVYDATKSLVVSPSDTQVVDNVIANQLTLTTCNPRFSATSRLVVQAKLAHSQLFPNSGLPVPGAHQVHADPKSQSLAGNSDVSLAEHAVLGVRDRPRHHGHLLRRLAFPAPALGDLRGRRPGHARAVVVLLRGDQPAAPRQLLTTMLVEEPLADHFRGFAAVVERDGGSTYPAICRAVADDDNLLSLLAGAPLPQRRPLLLMAAVHFLLLSGVEHPLAAFYDTVGVVRDIPPGSGPRGDVAAAFADFCHLHRTELERLIATRSTQTNEVGRCSALLPGLCHVAAEYEWQEPLSLLDLGTSAGLNLLFDDYAYTYRAAEGGAIRTAGAADSAVALECSVRDDLTYLPELRSPAMAERVGLDLSPVDPFSDDDALWLLACQWPDNPARFERLRAALANVRAAAHPPRLERGDMLTDLPRVGRFDARQWAVGRVPLLGGRLSERGGAAVSDRTGRRARRAPPRPPPLLREPLRDARPAHPSATGAPGGAGSGDRAGPHRPPRTSRRAPRRYPPARVLDPVVATAVTSPVSAVPCRAQRDW